MKAIICAIALITITSCATSYQSHGFTGGYSSTQISENSFVVYFAGNGYTGKQRAARFVLRRSAEITLENDFRYFQIMSGGNDTDISAGGGRFVSKPSSSNTIMCFKDKPTGFHYDAQMVVNHYENLPPRETKKPRKNK